MELVFKIILIVFGYLTLDRILLFFERKYYAQHGTWMFKNTDPEDLELEKE